MKKILLVVLGVSLLGFNSISADGAVDTKFEKLIAKLMGTPYRAGGTTAKGFDCSGFTMYVFKHFNIKLPHQSKSQFQLGRKVLKPDLKKGDLVFFKTGRNGISHVGIYLENGKFVHSANRKGIVIDSMSSAYYVKRYVGAKRIPNMDVHIEELATAS